MARALLVDSVHRLALGAVAPGLDDDLARAASAACDAIEERTSAEEERIVERATSAGLSLAVMPAPHARQNHAITVRTESFDDADRLARLLATDGYERWERWTGGALESFRRTATMLTVGRTDDVTTVVRVRWAEPRARNVARRLFVPTSGDWHLVDLPRWAWPVYSLLRPARHVAERLGMRRRHEASLGPFLTTPDNLLPALFEFAAVGPTDRVVDLGCGDGRIAIAAAEQIGCRTLGIESDPQLAGRAAERAAMSPASDLIEIVHGDARAIDLSEVTVAFVFLPVGVVGDIVGNLRDTLRSGARIVAHEQSALPADLELPPSRTELVVACDAVTVAHLWVAEGATVS